MGTITEVSTVLLSEWNENAHAKYLEENYQAAEPQVSYSGLCASDLVPGWFPIIVHIKSPGLDPPPFFQLPVSRDNNQPVMGVQLGMHNSCLSYLNPASNRTATEQGRLWVRNTDDAPIDLNYCHAIDSSVRHLNLMLPFPWGSVPLCCILLYALLARYLWHCTLHQNDGIVCIYLVSPLPAVRFPHPSSSLLTFISESFPFSLVQHLCKNSAVFWHKELIFIYEQEDDFSKPKQDLCRLCLKGGNIFRSELFPSLFGCN